MAAAALGLVAVQLTWRRRIEKKMASKSSLGQYEIEDEKLQRIDVRRCAVTQRLENSAKHQQQDICPTNVVLLASIQWWNELEFEFEVRPFLGVRVRKVRPQGWAEEFEMFEVRCLSSTNLSNLCRPLFWTIFGQKWKSKKRKNITKPQTKTGLTQQLL